MGNTNKNKIQKMGEVAVFKVTELLKQGIKYSKIAKEMGVRYDVIKRFAQQNGLDSGGSTVIVKDLLSAIDALGKNVTIENTIKYLMAIAMMGMRGYMDTNRIKNQISIAKVIMDHTDSLVMEQQMKELLMLGKTIPPLDFREDMQIDKSNEIRNIGKRERRLERLIGGFNGENNKETNEENGGDVISG